MPIKKLHLLIGCLFSLSVFFPQPSAAQAEWTSLPDAIEPRVEGHSAFIDGKIYVFGGFQTEDIVPTDQNEVYNLATNSWSTFTPLPVPNTHVGSAEADGKVWIAGGFALIGFIQTVDIVWIYDPVTDTFSDGPSLPSPRAGGTLVRLGRKLHYISGLINRNDTVGDHFVLDLDEPGGPQTWTMLAPMPDSRDHLSGIAVGGKIYTIGGQFGHDLNPQDTNLLHEYDPVTDSWTRKADLPIIRSHFEPGTIVVDGKIIIAGGRTGTQNCVNTVTQYDPVANAWSELFTMPSCLLAPSAKVIDDEFFLSHGGKVSVLFPTTDAFKRDFDRSPSSVMSFSPATHTTTLAPGESEIIEPLLWTLTDEANYSISLAGLPAWITNVSKTSGTADIAGDEIDITLNATGLEAGLYTHTFTATASGYDNATLTIQLTVSGAVNQSLQAGWNLIGLPVAPTNPEASAIYSDVSLALMPFAYEGNSYIEHQAMEMGTGYWLKVNSAGVQTHSGTFNSFVDVALAAGWNMISGPSCPSPIEDASGSVHILQSGTAYSYSDAGGYLAEEVLQPGQGYWIESSESGSISFNCGSGKTFANNGTAQPASVDGELPGDALTLTIKDARGYTRTLYINEDAQSLSRYNLPPIPPRHQPDVRFLNSSSLMTTDESVFKIQAMQAPLTLSLGGKDEETSYHFSVEANDTWEVVVTMTAGQEAVLDEPALERLLISKETMQEAAIPDLFALQGAYPNPFQSSVTVTFDAPENGTAHIEFFDMLGKRVLQTLEQPIYAGARRTIRAEGQSLASGAYMYRLVLQTPGGIRAATGRVVLVR